MDDANLWCDEPIRIPVTDVFDLHTVPPREVKAVVENYLEEAYRLGFRALRIIHGRGIGVQREMVRSILARALLLAAFRMRRERPAAGGRPSLRCGILDRWPKIFGTFRRAGRNHYQRPMRIAAIN